MGDWYDYLQTQVSTKSRPQPGVYRPRPVATYNPTQGKVRQNAGGLGTPRGSAGGVGGYGGSSDTYTPATMPERFDFSLPFTKPSVDVLQPPSAPAKPQASTAGDPFGSIAATAAARVEGGINIANAIPWVMERTHEAARAIADSNKDNPIGAASAGVLAGATDLFLGAFEAASDVVGPVIDAIPNWARDDDLKERAKLYQAILNGDDDLTSSGLHAGVAFKTYRSLFLRSVDPHARLDAQTQMALIHDQIDLPESVKQAIAASPAASEDQIVKMLDAAPEGRAWSYKPGPVGFLQNAVTPLMFYLPMGMGTLSAAKSVLAFGAATGGRTAMAVSAAAKATTVGAQLQKYMMLSGAGTAALTTSMEVIQRTLGNQAAIDWLDNVQRPGDFANNPNVQLVSGFSVNPFAAAGDLAKGTIKLASGTGNIVLNRALGTKLLRYYTDDDLILGQLAKMYKMGSADEFKAWNDANGVYEHKGQMFDEVVGLAADHVLDRLPLEERLSFAATYINDPIARSKAVLTQYGEQTWDALANHSDEIAQRFYDHSWRYADMPGAFSAEIAGLKSHDYRGAKARTFEFRAQNDAVVTYQEYLAPEGQQLARQMVDAVPGDTIPIEGRGGLQNLISDFPALHKYWQGLVDPNSSVISKANVETMLTRAARDYAAKAKQNPVNVRTGADPVLRPDSPRADFDMAEALGTDIETVRALYDFKLSKPDATHVSKLRQLLVDKTDLDPAVAATMDPGAVWAQADEYVSRTTEPWVKAGQRIVAAEKRITQLRADLQRRNAVPSRQRTLADREAITNAETEMATLMRLTREAGDPIRPFSEDVRITQVRARNADRVRAMDPDRLTRSQEQFLRRYVSDDSRGITVADDVRGRDLWEQAREIADAHPSATGRDAHWAELADRKADAQASLDELALIDDEAMVLVPDGNWNDLMRRVQGVWQWSGGLPPMTTSMRESAARLLYQQGNRTAGHEITLIGDEAAWQMLLHPNNRGVLDGMTRRQRMAVSRAEALGAGKEVSDLISEQAVRRGVVTDTNEFVEKLAPLFQRRAEILDGRRFGQSNLQRTAALRVPPEYEVRSDPYTESVIFDAEFSANEHPRIIADVQRILASPDELYPALHDTVAADRILWAQADDLAHANGLTRAALLTDPANAALARQLIPEGFEPPTPGVVVDETPLDGLLMAGDREAIALRSEELRAAADGPHDPIPTTRARAQQAAVSTVRPSTEARRRLVASGGDLTASPSAAIMDNPANRIGMDAISVINHGVIGTRPATVGWLHVLLREIEDGGATRMGFGSSVQAEAQRVLRELIGDAVKAGKRKGFRVGEFGSGLDAAMLATDDHALARALKIEEAQSALNRTLERDVIRAGREAESQAANAAVGVARGGTAESGGAMKPVPAQTIARTGNMLGVGKITYEPGDPLGTLQYGLGKRPKDAVVMELAQVPGLAEEFVAGHFQPWHERVWTAQVRHAFNWVFGAHPNEAVHGAVYQAFIERAARAGVDGVTAKSIWQEWQAKADKSRDFEVRVDPETGVRTHLPGDNPLYASVANIPSKQLDGWAHEAIDAALDQRGAGMVDPAYRQLLHNIDYGTTFRESSSNMRRWLLGENVRIGSLSIPSPVPEPLGKALAGAYGMAAHNKFVTTTYYWFRFGLDVRYHAMNYWEAQILYLGRAGLRKGEIDTGLLGNTEGFLRRLDTDFVNNTGYATSRARFVWAYKTMLKEQPDALRKTIKGLQTEDHELMERALRELADADPQLHDMIVNLGETPDAWMQASNEWHGKMLKAASDKEGDLIIDETFATEIAKTPAMAEIYSSLGQANKDLWRNVRSTFYGNPDRSRAERFLNSYLLFWPLSYQIKASKWLLRVMYDRVGGLPTNGVGAVMLDRLAQTHQRLLATDTEYQDWYEKHETLVYMAQMLMPITPDSIGVSLNPILRSMFFNAQKQALNVGPVYTLTNLIPRAGKEVMVDLYPSLKDVPGVGPAAAGAYRTLTGKQVPKALR